MSQKISDTETRLRELARERILLLDGAMGTAIQEFKLDEAAFRGERFADWESDLKGNNDLLTLTQPDVIRDIHRAYFDAGADIVETNTFSSTTIAQADYHMESLAFELNAEGARLAREAADGAEKADGRPRFVAGALGPTNRTASISPDVTDPGYRAINFDQLAKAYGEAARGLVEGGADILLIETIFDTLNAKAAIFAIEELFEDIGSRLPVMISGTITDLSGRTLSGQTPSAFWNSVRHAAPLSIGLNCALGAKEMRPHLAELSRVADTLVCAYPNAGLPNAFGGYDETPEETAEFIARVRPLGPRQRRRRVLRHDAGAYRARSRDAVDGIGPREVPEAKPYMRLSGLEPFVLTPETNFVNIGERTNVTGSAQASES